MGQFGLQDANSPIIEELIFLLIFIITFVGFIIVRILFNSFINKNLLERQIIECIPAIILVQIAMPSLLLLYILDESIDSNLTIKAIGHHGTEGMSTEISERLEITLKS